MRIKIDICIPECNEYERIYAITTLLGMILDETKIDINIIIDGYQKNNIISYQDKTICIKDAFWCQWPDPLSYLRQEALPRPTFVANMFAPEKDLLLLFGDDTFEVNTNGIVCGADLIASAFFMLTRWEEYVVKKRDHHNRFPASASLAWSYGFLERPVVNEWAEMLKHMLLYLGLSSEVFKVRRFELVPTHDVDVLNMSHSLKTFVVDILKRRSLGMAWRRLKSYFRNPYNTFDFLMNCSEEVGVKSRFYFMGADRNGFDGDNYVIRVGEKYRNIVTEIIRRGHIVGFHPGYYSVLDPQKWRIEKERVNLSGRIKVNEGRQHYLRFEVPFTWKIWQSNNMEIDSTAGYADAIGFRCGTGDVYPVFDFLERKPLSLKERPLIVMDGTLKQYMGLSVKESREKIDRFIRVSKAYRMPLTILFHNSSFDTYWKGYRELYTNIFHSDLK